MKKLTNAMSNISDVYIDELKNTDALKIRSNSFRWTLVAATVAIMIVCISLFAIIGSESPDVPLIPSEVNESLSENISNTANINSSIDISEASSTHTSSNQNSDPNINSSVGEETSETNQNSLPSNESSFGETAPPNETSDIDSSWDSPNNGENGTHFTAQQIADFFGVREGDKTNRYEVMAFEDVTDIKTGALSQDALPMLIESDWKHEYLKVTVGGMEDCALYLDGKTIILSNEASYDEVYSIALEWLPHCQKYFGFEYSDIKVMGSGGRDGFYSIYYYDSSARYPYYQDGRAIIRTNSYLTLDIGSNVDSDIITLRTIAYKAENNSFSEGEYFNTISLEEAEAMLAKGYVFGGHTCPICMSGQNEIDFSDYDHVGIEYVQRVTLEDWTNEYYPFYAFYKEIEEGRYARTYVPAFRVSGMEEYFESQKSNHNSSGLIPV